MTEQEVQDFAQSLAHEYLRVRQEWWDAVKLVQDTRWNRDKEIYHYSYAVEEKDKKQAAWDLMAKICERMLPKEIEDAFNKARIRIEKRGKPNEGNKRS